jgi:hypothetical protein
MRLFVPLPVLLLLGAAAGFAPAGGLVRPACDACTRLAPRLAAPPRLSIAQETVDKRTAEPAENERQQEAKLEGAARTLRLNSIAAINAFVIGSFGLAIAYNLLHVDLQAIVALYQYPSGEVEEGFSKLAASLDLLARLPMDQIHAYEALVPTNPIFYKACTSGVAYTFGDFISQVRAVPFMRNCRRHTLFPLLTHQC